MTDNNRPNIIIEKNIPFIHGLLDDVADVRYLSADEINADTMRLADALITRTRTRCDADLLEGSRCSIIASATIGLDHVDTDYCAKAGIEVRNAPGCNAPAVAQYVLASIISVYGSNTAGLTLGIVGVGNVGRIVEYWALQTGMNVLRCDPPRALVEGADGFVSIDEVAANADIITFHTPYTRNGEYATHHLFDSRLAAKLIRRPMIINSARGPITDTAALKQALADGIVSHAVIDCWENEPRIDLELLQSASIATPHIAGYSRQGKIRATAMAVKAVVDHFSLPMPQMKQNVRPGAARKVSAEEIKASYDPLKDTEALRLHPENFETLRNHYNLREEV